MSSIWIATSNNQGAILQMIEIPLWIAVLLLAWVCRVVCRAVDQ